MKTRKQIIQTAKKLYMHGKHPDIIVGEDASDTPQSDVIFTNDGTGAWVDAMVWVSLEDPPTHRNGRYYVTKKPR